MEYKYTWDQAIEILRNDSTHKKMIYDAYLSTDVESSCKRFEQSAEFKEVLNLIAKFRIEKILDVPAGNGIASYAFAINGYKVTAVEPDGSTTLGREAIRTIAQKNNLDIEIVDAWGEDLPFENESFDLVYVRQGLHHAADLNKMVSEYYRVLKKGGIILATREHVVNNYKKSLNDFLKTQVDHQLYGGENAFILKDYIKAFKSANFTNITMIDPYESDINLHPKTQEIFRQMILDTKSAKFLKTFLSESFTFEIGLKFVRLTKRPGRLFSFIATK